jgi:thiamine-phosphate diphosphorylase
VSGRTLPRLHVVTDDAVLAQDGWVDLAARVLEWGGPRVALHVRGPATGSRALLALTEALLPHARRAGATLLLNDRVDVALVSEADGVHLGAGSLTVPAARAILGPSRLIGASCHGVQEASASRALGADYVFMGTIFETPSHPGRAGLGARVVEETVGAVPGLPVIAIGGVGPDAASALVGAGAWGVAVIRGVWGAPDPGRAVSLYLEGLGEGE